MLKKKLNDFVTLMKNGNLGDFQMRSIKKEIFQMAVSELWNYCTYGMKVFSQHKKSFSSVMAGDLLNKTVLNALKTILFQKMDYDLYQKFLDYERKIAENIYAKYFHSYTKIDSNGRIYNEIIGMYWNGDVWEIEENGFCRFSAFMSYVA